MLGARDNLSSCGMLQPLIGLAAAAWGKVHQATDLAQVRLICLQCCMVLLHLPGVVAVQKGGTAAAGPAGSKLSLLVSGCSGPCMAWMHDQMPSFMLAAGMQVAVEP